MKILISDANIHNRQHLAAFLGQSGLEVAGMAASGEETRALAEVLSPTVILLEANLPDVDVYQLISELQRGDPPPAVILLTTKPDPEVIHRGLLAGAGACLAKSEGIDPIVEAIHQTRINNKQGAVE
jgi:DNA-binding NarL/FixJ family response regulator